MSHDVSELPILVVEDDESTIELERRVLVRARRVVRAVRRVDDALQLMTDERFRLAIVDYRLEDGDAWPILDAARSVSPAIPVILVTALGDERVAAEAIRRGAAEYLIKSGAFWDQLPAVVDRVSRSADVENLNALLASVVQFSDDAIIAGSLDGRIVSWNPAAQRLFGYRADEIVGRSAAVLFPPDRVHEFEASREALTRGGTVANPDTVRRRKDGTLFAVAESVSPIRNAAGTAVGVAVVVRDITATKSLEAQFRQSQKMEAIGRLAGGVAHDFNNLLTVINGYSEMLIARTPPGDAPQREVVEIRRAGERAATLTHQLLAFSRSQVIEPKLMDLNLTIRNIETLLGRLLGDDVDVAIVLDPGVGAVLADTGQVEQVVINLAVNARDAMPHGGRITIETSDVELGDDYARTHAGVTAGRYSMIAVSDTGCGMDEATLARAFEPFFTTKGVGKGTGLGLSTVHGIVHQSGGHVVAYSEPGQGTTIKVYLPRANDVPGTAHATQRAAEARGGTETILVAEDGDELRELACEVLRAAGYTVIDARGGAEAIVASGRSAGPIHLLLSDVIMRNVGGRELADRMAALRPEMRVLFMSGYTDEAITHHGRLDPGTAYLAKPFTPDQLLRKVREVLDAPLRTSA